MVMNRHPPDDPPLRISGQMVIVPLVVGIGLWFAHLFSYGNLDIAPLARSYLSDVVPILPPA